MPPSMKTLKFDITLMTGTFQQNMKRAFDSAKKAFKDFGDSMKKSNSFLDASNAIYMFGKQGVESITSLFHPYEALVGKVVAVGYAVKKACENFEQFEKAGLKASNAFKTGGDVKDFDKFKGMIQNQTAGGMGNVTEAMGALGNVRKKNASLNSSELSSIAELSTGASAFNGEEYADSFERLGDILGADAVSLDSLTNAGINFTFNEWQQVKAMNNRMMMHERNRIIIEKMKQTYKDAEKAEANTLSGMYRRIGNMLENLKVLLGEAIAPLAKPFFQLAVLIMNLAEGFVKPFVGIAKVIGAVFSPLTKLLTNCAGLCRTIGTLLGVIVTVWIAKWIKGQITILTLNGSLLKVFVLIVKGWRDATRYLQMYITTMKLANKESAVWAAGGALSGATTKMRGRLANMSRTTGGGIASGIVAAGKGIAKGWTKLSGGKGVLGAMGNIGSGMLAGGKGFLSLIASFGKGLIGLVRFAGPLALVAAAITAVAGFFKGWVKGFMSSFNKASGSSKSFMDILKQVGGIIMSIVDIILVPFKIIFGLFEKLGQMLGWLGGKIASVLLPVIENTVGALNKAKNAVADKAKEAYFWSMEKLGIDMSKQREEYKKYKEERDNPKKDDKGYTAPDIDFSSSFESAASMTQRIQSSIMSKNSPQAKMVDYLHDIREYMASMNNNQTKQTDEQKKNNQLMDEQNKALGNMNMGLA